MDINKTLQKLDELFATKQITKVEGFLEEQISIALSEGDNNALITLLNEMIGFQRDTSQYDKAIDYSKKVLTLMESLGLDQTTYYGTTLINVANAYRAAHMLEESMECYKKVFKLYEGKVSKTDFNYASLYNNMSLLYQEMNDYEKSVESLFKALEIVKMYPEAIIQLAVTYGNIGQSLLKLGKVEEALEYLNNAYEIFLKDEEKDFHYGATVAALGEAAYKKGQYEKAKSFYEEALYEINKNVGETEAYMITKSNLKRVEDILKRQDSERDNKETNNKETNNKEINIKEINNKQEKKNVVKCQTKNEKNQETNQDANQERNQERSQETNKTYNNLMRKNKNDFVEIFNALMDKFPDYKNKMAAGLVGEGSECFGFDDEYSRDHDFSGGFNVWLPDEVYRVVGLDMQRVYDELVETFIGKDAFITKEGSGRTGIKSINTFYEEILGKEEYIGLSNNDLKTWLEVDEWKLATATNGNVFIDNYGEFSIIREKLLDYYPEQVWKRRLANELYNFSQKGQYNYERMMKRGEGVTASIILSDFMRHTMNIVYILNKKYAPYYKWQHKGMNNLERLAGVMDILNAINDMPKGDERIVLTIEIIARIILSEMKEQGLVTGDDTYLEMHICEMI